MTHPTTGAGGKKKRLCLDCEKPLSRQNRFGRCRSCTASNLARDPEARARTVATMRRHWNDPAYRARVGKAISSAKLKRIATDPEYAEAMERKGRALGKSGLGIAAQDTPEFRERMGKTLSDVRLAWCPPEWRERYREYRRRKVPVDEAKARVLDLIPPFEIQLWKIRKGAGIVEVRPFRRAESAYSATGCATAAFVEAFG
jgi:hypothetical protein